MATPITAVKPETPSPPEAAIAVAKTRLTEDWLAVGIGLFVFVLSLALLLGADFPGVVDHNVRVDVAIESVGSRFQGVREAAMVVLSGRDLSVLAGHPAGSR